MKRRPDVPDDLTREEQMRLWAWVQTRHRHLTKSAVRGYVDECLSYWRARGNPRGYSDFEAACRNWIVKGERMKNERGIARHEQPQEDRAGAQKGELVAIGNVIDLVTRERRA